MTFQDYIKFLTERLVSRMDQQSNKNKSKHIDQQSNLYTNQWFGLFPLSWKLWRTK